MPRHWQVLLMAALGIGATVIAVPRALSGIVAVPHIAEAGISRTAASVPSSKPSTAKVPVWSAPAAPTAVSATTAPADTRPPSGVTGLVCSANNETTISLTWDAGQDNVAVKLYVIKGDGFSTIKTADTKTTVSWPHRTADVSVQVAAVDTSGNQGEWRSLVVTPPTPNAPATASATASATPSPPSTPPATTTTPVVTSSAPSQPATSASASTSAATAASTAPSTIQSAGAPSPSTTGASADPSSAQSI